MYENIKSLRPYFFSLREIENNVSLDLKLPSSWRYESILTPYRSITPKIQDKNDKFNLLSLVAVATKEGYDVVMSCANEIIGVNKEVEEKKKLFQEKVNELKLLFEKESLDKLKVLNFLEENGQQDTTSIRMVEQGNQEGRDGDLQPQEEDD